MAVAVVLVVVAAACVGTLVVTEALRHVRAARAQSAAGLDDDDVTPLATRIRLLCTEVVHTLSGWVTGLLPPPRRRTAGTRGTVVVATPSLSAHGAARRLASRLRAEGWSDVVCVRLGTVWPGFGAATARLARVLARRPGARVTIIAHGLAGLSARAASRDQANVRVLLTLGTPHGRRRSLRSPIAYEAVAIASPDDARLLPPGVAHWPDACNISVRGVGHLGMLRAPHVLDLVVESLTPPAVHGHDRPERDRRA